MPFTSGFKALTGYPMCIIDIGLDVEFLTLSDRNNIQSNWESFTVVVPKGRLLEDRNADYPLT